MILNELFDKQPEEMQDLSKDSSTLKYEDSRKTRLTLSQINRLRKMNDMRALEHEQEMSFVRKMYAPPAPQGDMGGMGGM
jgi:hypothetical protein